MPKKKLACDCVRRCGDDPWLYEPDPEKKAQPCATFIEEAVRTANIKLTRELLIELGITDQYDGSGLVSILQEALALRKNIKASVSLETTPPSH